MSRKVATLLFGDFDEVVETPPPQQIESWGIRAADIFAQVDLRLDANAYDPAASAAIAGLIKRGVVFKPLSDFADVFYRSRFKRIWAKDADHGLPYFNATDLLNIFALGFPSPQRYLSRATQTKIDALLVRHGWLLMACSGTVGRVFYVPKRLDGWAATHDIMRIVAHDPEKVGYLYAWLSTPLARAQMAGLEYGTQVDHLTDDQVASLPVPVLPLNDVVAISSRVLDALETRENAVEQLSRAWPT